jgi:molybdopterin adenylyltransferase
MKVGRITCSDRASSGVYEDKGGPEIERVFSGIWHEPVEFVAKVIPDERAEIETALRALADNEKCPLIITTGGTGFAERDVTPEATLAVLEKELPGFGEIMRSVSFAVAPTSILSRATAGVRGRSLIINLPGNPKAIAQCLPPLLPAIREALRHLLES